MTVDLRDAKTALAGAGAAAAGYIAYKVLKTAAWWGYVRFGACLADKFKGDYAIVSGGSEGIGLGIAEALAARGLNLVLVSRSEVKLCAASDRITAKHPGTAVVIVAADLTKDDGVQKVTRALDKAGVRDNVSLLVCNNGGGVVRAARYQDFSKEEDEYVRKLNGEATFALVKEFLPAMVARGKGFVLCISSLITKMPSVQLSNYYLEKAKINALAEVLMAEQDAFGTNVGAQAHTLGAVVTPGLATAMAPAAAAALKPSARGLGWEEAAVAPTLATPSARACGEWIVRAMGKGSAPVITPYPGHALLGEPFMDLVAALRWPACLRRAVAARVSRSIAANMEKGKAK